MTPTYHVTTTPVAKPGVSEMRHRREVMMPRHRRLGDANGNVAFRDRLKPNMKHKDFSVWEVLSSRKY